MGKKETKVSDEIRLELSKRGCIVLRSQVGLFYTKYGQEIHIGIKGESDLHGNRRRWKSILLGDKICWN